MVCADLHCDAGVSPFLQHGGSIAELAGWLMPSACSLQLGVCVRWQMCRTCCSIGVCAKETQEAVWRDALATVACGSSVRSSSFWDTHGDDHSPMD